MFSTDPLAPCVTLVHGLYITSCSLQIHWPQRVTLVHGLYITSCSLQIHSPRVSHSFMVCTSHHVLYRSTGPVCHTRSWFVHHIMFSTDPLAPCVTLVHGLYITSCSLQIHWPPRVTLVHGLYITSCSLQIHWPPRVTHVHGLYFTSCSLQIHWPPRVTLVHGLYITSCSLQIHSPCVSHSFMVCTSHHVLYRSTRPSCHTRSWFVHHIMFSTDPLAPACHTRSWFVHHIMFSTDPLAPCVTLVHGLYITSCSLRIHSPRVSHSFMVCISHHVLYRSPRPACHTRSWFVHHIMFSTDPLAPRVTLVHGLYITSCSLQIPSPRVSHSFMVCTSHHVLYGSTGPVCHTRSWFVHHIMFSTDPLARVSHSFMVCTSHHVLHRSTGPACHTRSWFVHHIMFSTDPLAPCVTLVHGLYITSCSLRIPSPRVSHSFMVCISHHVLYRSTRPACHTRSWFVHHIMFSTDPLAPACHTRSWFVHHIMFSTDPLAPCVTLVHGLYITSCSLRIPSPRVSHSFMVCISHHVLYRSTRPACHTRSWFVHHIMFSTDPLAPACHTRSWFVHHIMFSTDPLAPCVTLVHGLYITSCSLQIHSPRVSHSFMVCTSHHVLYRSTGPVCHTRSWFVYHIMFSTDPLAPCVTLVHGLYITSCSLRIHWPRVSHTFMVCTSHHVLYRSTRPVCHTRSWFVYHIMFSTDPLAPCVTLVHGLYITSLFLKVPELSFVIRCCII